MKWEPRTRQKAAPVTIKDADGIERTVGPRAFGKARLKREVAKRAGTSRDARSRTKRRRRRVQNAADVEMSIARDQARERDVARADEVQQQLRAQARRPTRPS